MTYIMLSLWGEILYLILRAEYTVIFETHMERIFISHLYEDDHQSIKVNDSIDKKIVAKKLLNGVSIPTKINKMQFTREEKTVITITKQLPEIFVIAEKKDVLKRHANIRGVLSRAVQSNVEPSIIESYLKNFNNQPIYMLGHDANLHTYLGEEGLPHIQTITEGNLNFNVNSIVLINDRNIPYLDVHAEAKYLLYSLDYLTVGPLLIPGITICLNCYNKYYEKKHTEDVFPVYHHNFIMNFLVNTIYYCINDLYKFMGIDVGLPIRKYYELSGTDLSLTATDVYKSCGCGECFSP